jgi:hypothetical protein
MKEVLVGKLAHMRKATLAPVHLLFYQINNAVASQLLTPGNFYEEIIHFGTCHISKRSLYFSLQNMVFTNF